MVKDESWPGLAGRGGGVNLDRVLASAPINGTAARVVAKGTHWEPSVCQGEPCFDVQPLTRRPTYQEIRAPDFKDLTGERSGSLVTVGIAKTVAKRWVCRCDCAMYVFRSAASIKAKKSGEDCCPRCQAKRKVRGK